MPQSPSLKFRLTDERLKNCQSAHLRYVAALEKKINITVSQEKTFKWTLKIKEIVKVKERKRSLEASFKSLETDIKEYSIASENENNLTLLTKANSFRVTFLQKKETQSIKNTLIKLNKESKQI